MVSIKDALKRLAERQDDFTSDKATYEHYAALDVDVRELLDAALAYLTNDGRWGNPPEPFRMAALSLAGRMYEIGYEAGLAASG